MIFKTIRERLKILEAKRKVLIYSKRYGMFIASGLVVDLEEKLSEELMDYRVTQYSENLDTNVVTLVVN